MNSWPDITLASVPPIKRAGDISLEVRRFVFGESKSSNVPCNIENVCREGGFQIKRMNLIDSSQNSQALLVPKIDGTFDILVDPSVKQMGGTAKGVNLNNIELHRFRFRIAHEIGHSFFYNRHDRPPQRLIPVTDEEERFCDYFASTLLLPKSIVERMPITAESILWLRIHYKISAEVAGRALANANPEIAVLGLLWERNLSQSDSSEGMRIKWGQGPYFIPLKARLKSSIVNSLRVSLRSSGVERLHVGGFRGTFKIDAARLVHGSQIVAILIPVTENLQLKLFGNKTK